MFLLLSLRRDRVRDTQREPVHKMSETLFSCYFPRCRTYERSEAATRLNSANYYSMCKLLLQMEDETDSKRSLRHDQHQQRVKHEFGHRYSLIIVCCNCAFHFDPFRMCLYPLTLKCCLFYIFYRNKIE